MSSSNVADSIARIERAAETNRAFAENARSRRAIENAKGGEARDLQAAARRAGEHGRDWQTLQQRIDLRKTTLSDIVSGVDLSDQARVVRQEMVKKIPEARKQFAESSEAEQASPEFMKLREAQEGLARAIEELNRLNLP